MIEVCEQTGLVGRHVDFFDGDFGAVFRFEKLERRFEVDTNLTRVGLSAGELNNAVEIFVVEFMNRAGNFVEFYASSF